MVAQASCLRRYCSLASSSLPPPSPPAPKPRVTRLPKSSSSIRQAWCACATRFPRRTAGIGWYSPAGGYTTAVLLDVNGDGDMEIAAVRDVSGASSLDIYDPVITTGPTAPGQSIGGVPWALLTSIPLENPVGVIGAGNLDGAVPGDEILLSARVPASGTGSSTVYKQSFYYLRNVGAQNGTELGGRRLANQQRGLDFGGAGRHDGRRH